MPPVAAIRIPLPMKAGSFHAGGTTTQTHTKTMSTTMPTTCAACAGFTYEVVLDVDGEPVTLSGEGSAFCSY